MRRIIHLDMDAFYASVEALDNPSLRGRPVIVGGESHRGVVSAASYEARRFGVHSALPIVTAKRLCPEGIFVPVRMRRYQEVSRQIFEIFHRFTPLVEPLSIDEAFLDVTGCARLFGTAEDIARDIRARVRQETGLTVSAGVAPSKLVAKIASDLHKPDGLTLVNPAEVEAFLAPLPIGKIWGVGQATQQVLARLAIRTVADLRRLSLEFLTKKFGKFGAHLYDAARGIDERPVIPEREAKSIGREETFEEDIVCGDQARRELLGLADRVARRLRRNRVEGGTVTLKVKYADFVQITRSLALKAPTNDAPVIFQACDSLIPKTEIGTRPVRLLGVSVSHLGPENEGLQLTLFQDPGIRRKRRKLNQALDVLSNRYGDRIIVPGALAAPVPRKGDLKPRTEKEPLSKNLDSSENKG